MWRTLPVCTDADTSVFQRDWRGSDTLGPFVETWIHSHAGKVMTPAGLAITVGDAFPKRGQSWILGLSIYEDGVMLVFSCNRNPEVRVDFEACNRHHHSLNLYVEWQLDLAGQGCQSGIRGLDDDALMSGWNGSHSTRMSSKLAR